MEAIRSGHYEWKAPKDNERRRRDEQLRVPIRETFEASHGTYGVRRIQKALESKEIHGVSRRKISYLMNRMGLESRCRKKRRVRTTDSAHRSPIAPNLLNREFKQSASNRIWTTDTTYVDTHQGWEYLTKVMDLYSRHVVGWAKGDTIDADLAVRALTMALKARKPQPGMIVHSDRGAQFASHAFKEALREAKAVSSMSRKGDCWDNACSESFFLSYKVEWVYPHGMYATREEAREDFLRYLHFYNCAPADLPDTGFSFKLNER